MENKANPIDSGRPYFMGQHALVRFSGGEEGYGPEVFWLVDKENHTIRPFESHMALDAAFGDGLQEALTKVVTIAQPKTDSNGDIREGVLADFNILGPEYSIKEDGTSKPLHFSPHQLRSRYGKPVNEESEVKAEREVDGLLNELAQNKNGSDMTAKFINSLRKDTQLMAFLIGAMSYGNYDKNDVHAYILKLFKDSKE